MCSDADTGVVCDHADVARLRAPLALPCGQVLPNRIAKAATSEGLADAHMNATPALETLYRRWSRGGAGLLITGNVQVDRWNPERPGNVVIDGAADCHALSRWAAAGTAGGNQFWMQLSHAGRQAPFYCSSAPVGPSAGRPRLLGVHGRPRALSAHGIRTVIERFAQAASAARDAGFTGVQIHAVHGDLISEFLSPLVNRRNDGYGGNLANRARLLLDIVRAVRAEAGRAFAVSVKLNAADFREGGFSNDDCLQIVRWLDTLNIDLLEISGGSYGQLRLRGDAGRGNEAESPRDAYLPEYLTLFRREARTPLMLTGGFRSRAAMADALASGDADVIGLGRPLCVDPYFIARLFQGTTESAEKPGAALAYGRGVFGPRSRFSALRLINRVSRMGWYHRQLVRMGRGQEPDWRMPLWRGLAGHVCMALRAARAVRAFQRQTPPLS